jgi:hypothetical protein
MSNLNVEPIMTKHVSLRALPVSRRGETIFIPLPPELWCIPGAHISAAGCSCDCCKKDGTKGYWDTLAVAASPIADRPDITWMVHHPQLHPVAVRKGMAR